MSASTVTAHLQTLNDLRSVIRADDGTYRLSLRFLEFGGRTRTDHDIYLAAHPQIDKLSRKSEEVATMGRRGRPPRAPLSDQPVERISDNTLVSEHTKLHWTALGKALLPRMPDDEIVSIGERHGLPAATENTITDVEALLAETNTVRERGYSIDDEESRASGLSPSRSGISDPRIDPQRSPSRDRNTVSAMSVSRRIWWTRPMTSRT